MDSGSLQIAVDIARESLLVAVKLAFPMLAVGILVGLGISILQAATQIQEQTLSFVPKMFVVVVVLILIMPWLLTVLVEYTEGLVMNMGSFME